MTVGDFYIGGSDSCTGDSGGPMWVYEKLNGQERAVAVGIVSRGDGCAKVVLRNVANPDDKKLSLDDGVLTLDCAFAQSPKGRFSDREIATLLESNL